MNARTAEQATTDACRRYQTMLDHAARGDYLLAAQEAASFTNAALLAQLLELRQIRMRLARIDRGTS